jgi:hypothetical protein
MHRTSTNYVQLSVTLLLRSAGCIHYHVSVPYIAVDVVLVVDTMHSTDSLKNTCLCIRCFQKLMQCRHFYPAIKKKTRTFLHKYVSNPSYVFVFYWDSPFWTVSKREVLETLLFWTHFVIQHRSSLDFRKVLAVDLGAVWRQDTGSNS